MCHFNFRGVTANVSLDFLAATDSVNLGGVTAILLHLVVWEGGFGSVTRTPPFKCDPLLSRSLHLY